MEIAKSVVVIALCVAVLACGGGNESAMEDGDKQPAKVGLSRSANSIVCDDRKTFLKVSYSPNIYSNIDASIWLPDSCVKTLVEHPVGHFRVRNTYQPAIAEFTVSGDPRIYWTYARYIK